MMPQGAVSGERECCWFDHVSWILKIAAAANQAEEDAPVSEEKTVPADASPVTQPASPAKEDVPKEDAKEERTRSFFGHDPIVEF